MLHLRNPEFICVPKIGGRSVPRKRSCIQKLMRICACTQGMSVYSRHVRVPLTCTYIPDMFVYPENVRVPSYSRNYPEHGQVKAWSCAQNMAVYPEHVRAHRRRACGRCIIASVTHYT